MQVSDRSQTAAWLPSPLGYGFELLIDVFKGAGPSSEVVAVGVYGRVCTATPRVTVLAFAVCVTMGGPLSDRAFSHVASLSPCTPALSQAATQALFESSPDAQEGEVKNMKVRRR